MALRCFQIADHDHQEIVEVVGDASAKLARPLRASARRRASLEFRASAPASPCASDVTSDFGESNKDLGGSLRPMTMGTIVSLLRYDVVADALPVDAAPTRSESSSGDTFETDLVPIMVAASEGKFTPLSSDDYLRRIEAAVSRGATLEAFLWFIERGLQDGFQPCQPGDASERCRIQTRLLEHAQRSADVQVLGRYLKLQSQEAADAIMALRDKAGANAYYIQFMAMNALPRVAFSFKSSDQEPLKSVQLQMRAALAAMPMIPAVYRDIGLIYFAAINPWRAWFAWEMGKANAGRSAEPSLWQFVSDLEQQVRQRRPEFF
jgi:hypothetical protein